MSYNLIAVIGPTASGKTRLAARLAAKLGSEVISADSRQVYRGLDIGTGKDLSEYLVDGVAVPYHLIDICDPTEEEFSVFAYQKRFYDVFTRLRSKGIVPIACGGTGLYLDAVLRRYDMKEIPPDPDLRQELTEMDQPELILRLRSLHTTLHNTTDLTDKERLVRAIEIAQKSADAQGQNSEAPEIKAFIIGIQYPPPILRERITQRLKDRLAAGMVEEIRNLYSAGLSWDRMETLGLEYRYIGRYLQGRISYEEALQELNTHIHQYAKRQRSWFRRMERQGTEIYWIEEGRFETTLELIKSAGNK
jgi:tRNA dimethylallyltransferase